MWPLRSPSGSHLFKVLPGRSVDAVVAGCSCSVRPTPGEKGQRPGERRPPRQRSKHGAVLTAFVVIFLAEWGDLTQILTANLAAKYDAPLCVGLGSVLALWAVAAIAVAGGQTLMRFVRISTIRKITAVVLLVLRRVHRLVRHFLSCAPMPDPHRSRERST